MDLQDRSVEASKSVVNGPRVVGKGPWINEDGPATASCPLDCVDQFALVVGLDVLHGHSVFGCGLTGHLHVVGQGGVPVDVGLPFAEQIQVGP